MTARAAAGPSCESQRHCTTCSDEAVPMVVAGPGADDGLAVCEAEDGSRTEVLIGLIDSVAVGDTLLVHAGTALVRLARAGESVA